VSPTSSEPKLSGLPITGVNPPLAAFAFLTKLARSGLVAVPGVRYMLNRLVASSAALPLAPPAAWSIVSPLSVLGLRPNPPASGLGEPDGDPAGEPSLGELPPWEAPSFDSSRLTSVFVVLEERTESNSEGVMRDNRR